MKNCLLVSFVLALTVSPAFGKAEDSPDRPDGKELATYKATLLTAYCYEKAGNSGRDCTKDSLSYLTRDHISARHFVVDFCVNRKAETSDSLKGECIQQMVKISLGLTGLPLVQEIETVWEAAKVDCKRRTLDRVEPHCLKNRFEDGL